MQKHTHFGTQLPHSDTLGPYFPLIVVATPGKKLADLLEFKLLSLCSCFGTQVIHSTLCFCKLSESSF